MKRFEDYIKSGEVKKVTKDIDLAVSLKERAIKKANFIITLKLNDNSSNVVFEDLYDCIRELCDAILAMNGYKSYSHKASILFLRRFDFTDNELFKLDRFRVIRNNSKYYGKEIIIKEAEEITLYYKNILNKLVKLIK